MIIDTHTHIGHFLEFEVTPQNLNEAMEFAGIDKALVFAFEHRMPWGITTEKLIKSVKPFPNLIAIGTSSPFTLNSGRMDYLKGVLQDRKIRGIKFYLGYEHYSPADERLFPLYESLSQNSLPAIFHAGYFWDPQRTGLMKYAHPLAIDEVAVRFPALKIVIAHMGNPWITDACVVAQRHPNVFLDISGYFTEFINPFSAEEVSEFREDMNRLYRMLGSFEKLLFATDWPICDMSEYGKIAESVFADLKVRETVFWKNAANLFQIQFPGV